MLVGYILRRRRLFCTVIGITMKWRKNARVRRHCLDEPDYSVDSRQR